MPVESFNGYRRNDDYLRDVARGGVVGARPFGAFGETTTSGAASGVIWPNGTYRFLPEAGVQLSLQSDSANDAEAGTGVRVVDVHGLDANLNEVSSGLTIPCPLAFTEGQVIGMTYKTDKAATINGSWFGCMENA